MTKPIHIVYIHETMGWGGAEILRHAVLRYIQATSDVRSRFHCTVICLRDAGPVGEIIANSGIEVLSIGWRQSLPSWRIVRNLSRLLRGLRPDIVHTCLYQAHLHGIVAARLAGCHVILMEEHSLNSYWMGWRERLFSICMVCLASRVVLVSYPQLEHLRDVMHYPEGKLYVVPNCIDSVRLGGRSGFVTGSKKGKTVTCIGSLREVKNHRLLLHAFRSVLLSLPECRLQIIGEGDLRGDLETLACELGIEKHVHFHGRVENIRHVLMGTDVYVQPGAQETFSISLAEAMYAGCACVALRVPVIEALTDHGHDAVLVSPDHPKAMADAIIDLLIDDKARLHLGELAAKRVIHHYLPEHHMAAMTLLYAEILP